MSGAVKGTQVLTPTGWLDIEAYKGETVALYNPDTRCGFWDTATGLERTMSNSVAVLHTKSGVHIAGSPSTTVPVRDKAGALHSVTIKDLLDTDKRFRVLAAPENGFAFANKPPIVLDDIVWRLWVMVLADGCEYSNNRIKVVVARKRKVYRATKLLLESGINFSQHPYFRIDSANPNAGQYVQLTSMDTLAQYPEDKRALYCDFRFKLPVWGKHVTEEAWLSLTERAARVIAEELPRWDGSVCTNGSVNWAGTNTAQCDFFQYTMLTLGIKAQIHKMIKPKPNWTQCYRMTFTPTTLPSLLIHRGNARKSALSGVYNLGSPVALYRLYTGGRPYITRHQGKVSILMGG